MREWIPRNAIVRQAAISAAIGAVLATIGPFGTFDDLPTADRFAYWLSIIIVNWLQISLLAHALARPLFAAGAPKIAIAALACIGAALPATFEVIWLERIFRPPDAAFPANRALPPFWLLYGYVLTLSLAISVPLANRLVPGRKPDAAPDGAPATDRFLRRIPARLGRDLLCVEAADHYLRVHTAAGDDLILLRMSDALAELEGTDGLRVHRSFWVARGAVATAERSGRGWRLALTNGLNVPVSRSRLGALRKAGWLDRGIGPGR